MRNYEGPNFVAQPVGDGAPRLYLIRCFECPDGRGKHYRNIEKYGRENWAPNVADGICAWCQWKADPDIVAKKYAEAASTMPMEGS